MPRRNSNGARERVFDTRMSFKQMAKKLNLTPLQRVKIIKYMKQNEKWGEHTK